MLRLAVARRRRGPLQIGERAQAVFFGQPVDVVLERVGDPAILDPDPRLALVLEPADGDRAIEHRVVVGVVRELDVAADVPGEALVVEEARRQAAGSRRRFEQQIVVSAELFESPRRAEAGRAGADDENLADVFQTRGSVRGGVGCCLAARAIAMV